MMETKLLEQKAKKLRKEVLDMAIKEGEAHFGGSFSIIEILISLYDLFLKKEDKFILSKGHTAHPMYILLKEKGYNPKIAAHPDLDLKNNIPCTTGSLGHGLPIGVGMAFARKFLNKEGHIYVLLGDGECQEGTTWESLMLANRFKLNNLTIIVDHNKLQALGKIDNFSENNDLKEKFDVFGFNTTKINGHSFSELCMVLDEKNVESDKPRAIIANTIKGKGVSFMENKPKWHTGLPTEDELKQANKELEEN